MVLGQALRPTGAGLDHLGHGGRWHPQPPSRLPQADTLGLQLEDLLTPVCQGRWASQPDTTALGSPEASVNSLPDQAAFEFSHGHEDAQLKPSCWVVATGINALGGANQGDAHSLQLIEDQSKVA